MRRSRLMCGVGWLAVLAGACPAFGIEHVTLRNGFAVDCSRREAVGDKVRLYPVGSASGADNYFEVGADSVASVEILPDPPKVSGGAAAALAGSGSATFGGLGVGDPTPAEMQTMLSRAGSAHNVDADLLASVMRAESSGRVRAVSRTGAQGLMQLMPGTARELGVGDAFAPEQNINGGTAYLDWLLVRYHDDVVKAVAAYNAGPRAVDRYHGVPPYRETRAYVARVIREFNRRKMAAMAAVVAPTAR